MRDIIAAVSALIVLSLAAPAWAGQHYSSWSAPGSAKAGETGQTDRVQKLIDELNTLIDEAEKARAADPIFLRDLRDLARGFHRPWQKLVLVDDFGDGEFTADPAWTVSAGRYWVERNWGLRSTVTAARAAPREEPRGKTSGRDAAISILGNILNQALGEQGQGGGTPASAEPEFAAIHSPVPFSNAFAIELEMSSWKDQGRLELGIYQGAERITGYRLAYTPGGPLELLRVSARGVATIDSSRQTLTLEDKKTHLIEWTRGVEGVMKVALDGKEMLAVTDRGIRDPFDGFMIVNRGGDYIVKRATIYGVE
ncbi:MAG: hypothetical protein QGI63_03310 [Rhodospirillales bacterium]|jgi:hypothetical protein|nr:hypothetical protein [Rhodospirillales bacterium]MDP6773276.1 hypothetical protein [Rhodospirillales bacterium]